MRRTHVMDSRSCERKAGESTQVDPRASISCGALWMQRGRCFRQTDYESRARGVLKKPTQQCRESGRSRHYAGCC
jgi:hypothetical protein